MPATRVHCTVVEIDHDAHLLSSDARSAPRDLLPWADPYIARLLTKYRLQAALDDSLRFLDDQAARGVGGPTDILRRDQPPIGLSGRFTTCTSRNPLPPASEDRP